MKLSVLVPVFNERYTVREVIDKVTTGALPPSVERELIVVDDCSTDGTFELLQEIAGENGLVRLVRHPKNLGKGAAVRTAIEHAEGDFIVVQDADLEYDPGDFARMLQPILQGDADVVYGSRFLASEYRRVLYFWHSLGNRFLTLLSNCLTDLNLTDMETCYKMIRADILKSLPIRCNRFGIEPELTAKLAKRGARIYEVPISYRGRTYEEGKKVTWWDGVKAIATMLRFAVVDDIYDKKYGHDILHRLSGVPRFNRWMADTVKPWVGDTVLEIGAGIGNLSRQLLPRERYTCSDVDPLHLRYLSNVFGSRPRVRVAKVDLENGDDFQAFEEQYDTVICLNVLEHVRDDAQALANIYTVLQPGGRLILLVPQSQRLYGSLDVALEHFRRYSASEVEARLAGEGFELETLFSFNRITVPAWYWNGKIMKRKTFGRLQLKIFDLSVPVVRVVDRILPWQGISLIAIARKPARERRAEADSRTNGELSER